MYTLVFANGGKQSACHHF